MSEQITHSLPVPSPPPSLSARLVQLPFDLLIAFARALPWWVWIALLAAAWWRTGKEKRRGARSTRRRAAHPTNAPRQATRPSLNHQLSQSSPAIRTSSPQLSRRGSMVFGPRGTPSTHPQEHPAYAAPPIHSPLRPSFSSRRLASLAQASRASPARQSYGSEVSNEQRYAPQPSTGRPQSQALPRSASFGPSGLSLPASPVPSHRRFTDGARKRASDDEGMREGKRWKQYDGEESDEEMDVEIETRGTKREIGGAEERGSKRSRVRSPEVVQGRRKRRASEEGAEESGKRAKSGRKGEMGSKRAIEEVDESSEESERNVPRNADSDVEEEEEEEESEEERPRRSKDGKRARSMEGRRESEDDDLMSGTMDDLSVPPEPSSEAASPRKRTLGSAKKIVSSSTAKARKGSIKGKAPLKAAGRKPGEEWTNIEGDRYRMGEDGLQRRVCEVREWRKKYKMPKDSRHPDRDAMHEVVVEKWLTDSDFDKAFEERKLAWQVPVTEMEGVKVEEEPKAEIDVEEEEAAKSSSAKERGIYYTTGTGTPLRTHSGLSSRQSSGQKNSGTSSPRTMTQSPSYTTLLNGRLRLPSGAGGGSPARSWSQTKARTIVEDEQKAMEERERRRKASIMLGGEAEPVEVVAAPAPAEKEKLKLSDFTAPPAAAITSAPKAVPSFFPSTPAAPTVASIAPAAATAPAPVKKIPSFFGAPPASTSAPALNLFAAPSSTPAPAANLFAPAAPAPVATPATPAEAPKASFSFAPAAPSTTAPKEEAKAPATGGFSFGAPAKAAPAPTTLSFSIPAATPAAEAPKASFSFGAPTPSSAPAPAAPVPSVPSFFTPASTPAPTPAPAAPKASFSFGASTTAPTSAPSTGFSLPSAAPALKPAGSFSFGTPSSTPAPAPAAPASFSFAPATTAPASAPAARGFSFGAPSSAAPPSFGAAAPAPVAGGFGFGTPSSAPAPSFGMAAAAPAPATGGFGFGTPSAAPASSFGGFGAATTAAPSFGTAPAPSFGGFGAAPATSTPGGFGFGAPAPAAAPAAGGFSFGASPATTPGAAFGTPAPEDGSVQRRRTVRRLPGR